MESLGLSGDSCEMCERSLEATWGSVGSFFGHSWQLVEPYRGPLEIFAGRLEAIMEASFAAGFVRSSI